MTHKINAVVFDMDGVLRIGNKLIKDTENILVNLQKQNIKTCIVTNECRYTVSELKNDLEEMGLIIPPNQYFYTAALSAKDYLKTKIIRFPTSKFVLGIVGELGLYETINQLTQYENVFIKDVLDPHTIHDIDKLYIIIGTVNTIKIKHLRKILNWINLGAKVITTCKDTSDPSSKGDFNLGMPSHMLHMTGYNKKMKSYSTGKPHPIHKQKIQEYLDMDPKHILFVGDTIHTDICLAEESGYQSCLVLSGNSNQNTLRSYVTEPDFILNDITELENHILLHNKKYK